jgi:hypothetical protein
MAVGAAKLVRWVSERRNMAQPLPLDVGDLTEIASIPPPAPPPRHHPRVPSLSRPDVHAFEASGRPLVTPPVVKTDRVG